MKQNFVVSLLNIYSKTQGLSFNLQLFYILSYLFMSIAFSL